MKEKPLSAYYDEVLIPALALAQYDVVRGKINGPQRAQIRASVEEVLDDLSDHEDMLPQQKRSFAATVLSPGGHSEAAQVDAESEGSVLAPQFEPTDLPTDWQGKPVLCVASRSELDEAAAAALAQLLGKHGIGALVIPWEATSPANLRLLDPAGVQMLCVSCLDSALMTHVRFVVKRFRRKFPGATVMVGFWTLGDDDTVALSDQLEGTGANLVVRSLREMARICSAVLAAKQDDKGRAEILPE